MTKANLQKGIILSAWVLGALFVGLNVTLGTLYANRIYPGIKIGSVAVGGMSRQQAAEALDRQVAAFHLSLTVDSQRYNIKPSQFGATYNTALSVDGAYGMGRDTALPLWGILEVWRPQQLAFSYTLDRPALKDFVSKLSVSQAQAPVDASVTIENGVPKVLGDKSGLGIDKNKLIETIIESIDAQVEQVVVTRAAVAADVRVPQATTAADAARKLMSTSITLTYNDKTFKPSASQIGSWLTFAKTDANDLQVGVDAAKVKGYFDSFAGDVEIAAIAKKVTAVNGEVKNTEGGTNGLAIDRDNLAQKIGAAVLAASPATIAVPTVAVAFKTIYNNSISLDAPKYIEINLSTQHLWAYQDHQLVFESPITSGATGAGFATVQGLFSIYGKERNRYLDGRPLGYNYNVFVQYWMPFYADYGLHDASWRSTFGGQDYYYGGSHGCVNLPTATAAWLWDWDEIGTPVWVHS